MNATSDDNGLFGYNSESGFSYGIGVSIGILILITTITLASYFCAKSDQPRRQTANEGGGDDTGRHVIEVGIDEATLLSYPKLLYPTKASDGVTHPEKDSAASCCSICLADYKSNDMLRLLPDCGHIFHLKCVDPWLRSHATCPLCRTSPLPTPLSTPLAEVVPLGSRRNG